MANIINDLNIQDEFNWEIYLELNQDLPKTIFYSQTLTLFHWINFGKNEGRKSKISDIPGILEDDFDWEIYTELNQDLYINNFRSKEQVSFHWIKYGKKEARKYKISQIPTLLEKDFYWEIYLECNPNLINSGFSNEERASFHWIKYGRNEGKKYKISDVPGLIEDDFIWEIYLEINPELVNKCLNSKELVLYNWIKYGRKEGKKYKISDKPELLENCFYWEIYLYLNPDLYSDLNSELVNKCLNSKELVMYHWIKFGRIQGRKYKISEIYDDEFDWEIYLELNPDLLNNGFNTKELVFYHFKRYSKIENRKYKISEFIDDDFDWESYLDLNYDLVCNGINSEKKAINHWRIYGKKEKRQYKISEDKYYCETYFKLFYNKDKDIFNKKLNFKNIRYIKNDYTSFIDAKDILNTVKINVSPLKFQLIDNEYINKINDFILIVDFPNWGGGTTMFINQIVSHYKMYKNFIIIRNYNNIIKFTINDEYELNHEYNEDSAILFLNKYKGKIEKIFVNHTLRHNIKLLNKLFDLKKEVVTITHDFYSINEDANPYIHNISLSYSNDCKLSINKYHKIITQNEKNLLIISDHITNKNIPIIVTELPDFKESKDKIITNNSNLVIGILGHIMDIKGYQILKRIINFYSSNENVKIIVFGLYNKINFKSQYIYNNIYELNDLLIEHKPNILIELSIWPETYSYTLSLAMITNLPIIYFKKTGNFVIEERLSHYNKAFAFETIEELNELAINNKQNWFYTIKPIIYFNSFWDEFFNNIDINKNKKKKNVIFKNKINMYPIYFPQFHEIKENNISFYQNYTDVENLKLLSEIIKTETPNLNELGLTTMIDYNLENIYIIQKQIDIIEEYNISGFAMYYYWFSLNTISTNNMIMNKVIDIFFSDQINMKDRKIFFIWANESWTNNPAFGNSDNKIENSYTEENINKNVNNLIIYFKNNNYLKIDNKPVFLLYHEWFMNSEELILFKTILTNVCIKNNFNGVYFILNSMNNQNLQNFDTFYINFNYKKSSSCKIENGQTYLDYKSYLNEIPNGTEMINTLVFDFDNRARLFKPDKLNLSTICKNNNLFNKILFMDKIISKYEKKLNINNILLVNAWNEWGEKMCIEPSQQYGYFYLNLINDNLNIINDYENLFNKYIYNLSNVNDNINYSIINNINRNNNNLIINIHCYDLNLFVNYFNEYLDEFIKYNIYITYVITNDEIINKYNNFVFLKIINKGYDIGGKIVFIDYIKNNNINYEYILFIHSKSDSEIRKSYIMPFYKNINLINSILNNNTLNKNVYGIFPNLQHTDFIFFKGTVEYRKDILNYLNCSNKENIFIEGNVMILKKCVIEYIFYSNLKIYYNILNDENTFDINWFKFRYSLKDDNNYIDSDNNKITNLYLNNKNDYYSNDFNVSNLNPELNIKDCMIEHVFERIWLNIIKHLNGEYLIL